MDAGPPLTTAVPSSLSWSSHGGSGDGGDGQLSRSLDTIETFFKKLADAGAPLGREHWEITLALRLRLPSAVVDGDPLPYLQRAWLHLREIHAHLAATTTTTTTENAADEPQTIVIEPLNAERWVSETFFHEVDIPDSSALFHSFRPSRQATCHWVPASQELVIRSSHWRIDGIGMCMLAHHFMERLVAVLEDGPDSRLRDGDGDVPRNLLTPNIDHLVGSYRQEDTTPSHLRAGADALVAEFVKGVPSIALPTKEGSKAALPGPSARRVRTFDIPTTTAILAACKSRGLGVNAALHAALIRVAASYPQHPLAKSYAAFFATNLRPLLPAPYNGPDYAGGIFLSGLPLCVTDVRDKDFDAIWEEVSAVYRRDLRNVVTDEGGKPAGMLDLIAPYVRRTTQLFNTPPPPELPPVENPDLSAFGRVEDMIQREYPVSLPGDSNYNKKEGEAAVVVEDFWQGTAMLPRSLQCHVWTFRDQLRFQSCYNTSFYDEAFVDEVLGKVEDELLRGLGIRS